MRRLTALDSTFLLGEEVNPAAHAHTLKVSIIRPVNPAGYDFEATKNILRERIHRLPPFRWKLLTTPWRLHHPVWIEDPDFDLDFHVRRTACPAPGTMRELCELISDMAGRPLDRARPLWELWIIEGLEGGRIATVAKVHHALADGVASAELLNLFYDASPEPGDEDLVADEWQPEEKPSRRVLVRTAARDLAVLLTGDLPAIVRRSRETRRQRQAAEPLTAPEADRYGQLPKPFVDPARTPFNAPVTPHRLFTVLSVGLDEVKRVRMAFGTTVNDVLLASAAGGLRRYLLNHHALPDQALVASIPVSTRTEEQRLTWGNRLAKVYVWLRTDIEDPVERLRASQQAADAAKQDLAVTKGARLENWIEFMPPRLIMAIGRYYSRQARSGKATENLIVSNVPGPPRRLYIAGAPMETFFSVGPLADGIGLNVTAWSYAGDLNVCLLSCRELIPDLWDLTGCIREAFDELRKLADERSATQPS